jgi:signal transduction histidine kinase
MQDKADQVDAQDHPVHGWDDPHGNHGWGPRHAAAAPPTAPPPARSGHIPELAALGLDDLVTEVVERLQSAASANDRLQGLLEAVVAVAADLDLHTTLLRIVEAATELVDARYGALGVIGADHSTLSDFITVGMTEEEIASVGELPRGRGVLGLLIDHPEPLRLDDLTQHPGSYGFPPNHPPMHSFVGVPIRVRGEMFGNLYLTEKRGRGSFTYEDKQVLRALAAAAGVAIENARLYETAQLREQWITAAAGITTNLLTTEDPHEALTVLTQRARVLAKADFAAMFLPQSDGSFQVEITDGNDLANLNGTIVPPETPLAREIARGSSLFTDDLATEPDIMLEQTRVFGPSLLVPLEANGKVLGALELDKAQGSKPFSDTERAMATAFAAQAALALVLAGGQHDRERLAVFEDRDRIARDLHDLVIQRLFATGMMLQGAARLAVVPEVTRRVNQAVDELDATIREVRSTIFQLQQSPTDAPAGVRAQVLREANDAARALGFDPAVMFTGAVDSRTPDEVVEQLLPALREALSNVARHAHATKAEVSVAVNEKLVLRVLDDGVGIAPGTTRNSGLGNLAERARELGGDSTLEPGPNGTGTVLTWTVPV